VTGAAAMRAARVIPAERSESRDRRPRGAQRLRAFVVERSRIGLRPSGMTA